eukprot:scaffold13706_cov121-Isochrysis_galbana.AAC.12
MCSLVVRARVQVSNMLHEHASFAVHGLRGAAQAMAIFGTHARLQLCEIFALLLPLLALRQFLR